jgi:drug/metabolite transporter (DMT)-like permease
LFLKPSPFRIFIILFIAVLSVSTAAIWIRLAMKAANDYTMGFSLFLAASRLIISALILIPSASKIKSDRATTQAILFAVIAGVCLACHFASWITSLAFTSIVASTTLVTTNPIWVGILSRFFWQEKLSRLTILGIGIALIGGVLIGLGNGENINSGSNPFLGNGLALIGAIMASLYIIFGTQAQQLGLSIRSYVTIAYSTGAIALFPLPLFFDRQYTGYSGSVYFYIILMAVLSQTIGHTGFNWALRWLSPTLVTLSILGESIISSILGAIVFQEIPSPAVIWGGLIVLLGVAIAVRGNKE